MLTGQKKPGHNGFISIQRKIGQCWCHETGSGFEYIDSDGDDDWETCHIANQDRRGIYYFQLGTSSMISKLTGEGDAAAAEVPKYPIAIFCYKQ